MMIVRTLLIQGPAGPPGVVKATPASWTPGAILNGAFANKVVTVTGAIVGVPVMPPAWSAALPNGVITWGQVTAADTVTVYMVNLSGSTQTIGAGNIYVEALST